MKALEINVDDLFNGGVYSLVKEVIVNNHNKDITIDIAAIEKFQKQENIDLLAQYGTSVYYVGCETNKIRKQFCVYRNLKKFLENNHYDCVHIHSDVSNKLFVSGLAAKKAGVKKIILHSHASGIDGNHRFIKYLIHIIMRPFLKRIGTEYVACSDVAANWMFPSIDVSKIKIIKNGIDVNKFKFDESKRGNVRKELNLSDNNIVLGHVGRFSYQKNNSFLIKILKEAIKENPNYRLLMVGSGPDEEKVKGLVKKQNLEDYCIFYGLSNKVDELYQAMDVVLFPSHSEGLCIAGIEAQSTGLPTIFSDKVPRLAKIIDNVSFLPIEHNDAVIWAKEIAKYSAYIYKRVDCSSSLEKKGFTIKDTIDDFVSLYI